jgi:hypothetical protein
VLTCPHLTSARDLTRSVFTAWSAVEQRQRPPRGLPRVAQLRRRDVQQAMTETGCTPPTLYGLGRAPNVALESRAECRQNRLRLHKGLVRKKHVEVLRSSVTREASELQKPPYRTGIGVELIEWIPSIANRTSCESKKAGQVSARSG